MTETVEEFLARGGAIKSVDAVAICNTPTANAHRKAHQTSRNEISYLARCARRKERALAKEKKRKKAARARRKAEREADKKKKLCAELMLTDPPPWDI